MLFYACQICLASAFMLAAVFSARILISRRRATRFEGHRGLFYYSDGVRARSIDPIAAYLALESHAQFRFDRHPRLAAEGDPESMNILAAAVREAFDVPAYTQPGKPGLTVSECHQLLRAYVLYVEAQKKSIEDFATPAPSMDATSPKSSETTTSDSSPSGSLESVPA